MANMHIQLRSIIEKCKFNVAPVGVCGMQDEVKDTIKELISEKDFEVGSRSVTNEQ